MSRKQAVIARAVRLGIVALALLLFAIFALAGDTDVGGLVFLSIVVGVVTLVMAGDQVYGGGFIKLVLIIVLGPIFALIACIKLILEIKRLNEYGDDFSTNFKEIITWTNGEQYKIIARIFCRSNFYAITQPYPLPRDFDTTDVIVYRMYKNKKDRSVDMYHKAGSAEADSVLKTYRKLLKKGKIKVNALQKSIYDMNVTELKQYITSNNYKVSRLEYFDNESKKDFLLTLTLGYELKVVFGDPKDSSKWTQEQLNGVIRYYVWEINWEKSMSLDYVMAQAERLEINRFYRLCKVLDNVIDEQKAGARGLVDMPMFSKLLESI